MRGMFLTLGVVLEIEISNLHLKPTRPHTLIALFASWAFAVKSMCCVGGVGMCYVGSVMLA